MTPQDLATEAERRRVMEGAFRRASERTKNSPDGLRQTAVDLRESAMRMPDNCDRTAMLRLAAEYEHRAGDAERRLRSAPRALRGTMSTTSTGEAGGSRREKAER